MGMEYGMKYCEKPVCIEGNGFQMLGIVSLPATKNLCKTAAVLIVTGGFQSRIGSHRQFTKMSRELAIAGYPTMRFDLPGLGDSPGELVAFDQTDAHISAAVKVLASTTGLQNIILWGLCDGASAILLYLQKNQDHRISGLVLVNPWIRSETSLARAQIKHYYRGRILEISFWQKLLNGKVGLKATREFWSNLLKMGRSLQSPPASLQNAMAQGWSGCKGPILLLLSENDLTSQEFGEYLEKDSVWRETVQKKPAVRHTLLNADHTCSQSASHEMLVEHTRNFLDSKNF